MRATSSPNRDCSIDQAHVIAFALERTNMKREFFVFQVALQVDHLIADQTSHFYYSRRSDRRGRACISTFPKGYYVRTAIRHLVR